MTAVLYLILLALLLSAAVVDLRARLIPNRYPAAILLLFLPVAVLEPIPDWPWHLVVFAGSFVVCVGMFAAGLLGGGDAKLLPATALWAGPEALPAFLIVTAGVGGAIALAMLAARYLRALPETGEGTQNPPTVPYGVAIAAGGLVIALQPLLNAFSSHSSVVSSSGV